MPANFAPTAIDYLRFLPEILLIVFGTLIMVMEPLLGDNKRNTFASVTLVGLIAALVAAIAANDHPGLSFSNMLIVDGFATFFRVLVIGVGIFTVLSSSEYLRREHADAPEYYALLLFSISANA